MLPSAITRPPDLSDRQRATLAGTMEAIELLERIGSTTRAAHVRAMMGEWCGDRNRLAEIAGAVVAESAGCGPASCGCGHHPASLCGSSEVASIDDPRADDFEVGPEMFSIPVPPEAGLSLDVRLRDEETREPIPARPERLACTRAGWPETRPGLAAMTGQIERPEWAAPLVGHAMAERPSVVRVPTCWRVQTPEGGAK